MESDSFKILEEKIKETLNYLNALKSKNEKLIKQKEALEQNRSISEAALDENNKEFLYKKVSDLVNLLEKVE
ncbi:MAG: hypothetical protein ACE5GI_08905 [Candidatus Aminicenantales bacterium]